MYFPLFVDLTKKDILVIGGGQIAARRIRVLSEFSDHLTVIAPDISEHIRTLCNTKMVGLIQRAFVPEDLKGRDLVFAATNDAELNRKICDLCREQRILFNACTDQTICDFFFPSVISKDDVIIGINASGQDHGKVREIRRQLEEALEIEDSRSYYC